VEEDDENRDVVAECEDGMIAIDVVWETTELVLGITVLLIGLAEVVVGLADVVGLMEVFAVLEGVVEGAVVVVLAGMTSCTAVGFEGTTVGMGFGVYPGTRLYVVPRSE